MSHDSSPSISNALRLYKLILSSGITIPFSYIAAIPAVLITALEVKQAGEEALEERHNFQEVFCALRTTTTVDDSIPDPPSDSYLTIRRSLIDQ
ncbi:hypothetical protein H0H87_005749 [Tephrocybe sp. NHM501043]|nr:hypothetical protein H0H87_005749 [Tephrocybe sp. NHM501043]